MNGFQIGNKRLKVQHKRVHNNSGGSRVVPQAQAQAIVPNDPKQQPQQQQAAIPLDAPETPLDTGAPGSNGTESAGGQIQAVKTPVILP